MKIEKGNDKLFKTPCDFLLSVAQFSALPEETLPEVAFAGRSNVGKSSIINAIFNSRRIARVSNTPGRTQHLNYFRVGEKFYFVDMPGYGFAQAPKTIVLQWKKLMARYLSERATLKRVYILIDARHGIKSNDKLFMSDLDKMGLSYQLIMTKSDKISATQLEKTHASIMEEIKNHPAAYQEVLKTSSEKKRGLDEVRTSILKACLLDNEECLS
jgi:GTP-binding protein